jgi:hypothetical protein
LEKQKKIALTIYVSKTKYIINRKKKWNEQDKIEINGQRYENVEMFKYLGSLVTDTDEVQAEMKDSITAGNKCYYALCHLLKKDT